MAVLAWWLPCQLDSGEEQGLSLLENYPLPEASIGGSAIQSFPGKAPWGHCLQQPVTGMQSVPHQ